MHGSGARLVTCGAGPLVAALALPVVGCAAAHDTPARAPRPPAAATAAPAAGPVARWRLLGASTAGVRADGGRLALVDGVRVWVGDDGAVRPADQLEPLDGVVRVPTTDGAAWIAWAGRAISRMDAPLAAPTPLAVLPEDAVGVDAWTGLVRVRTRSRALWLDLAGRERPPPTEVPPDDAAFVDARVGAALFPGSGLAATLDGGATWRLLDAPGAARVDADEGWLRVSGGRGDARLLPTAGRLDAPPTTIPAPWPREGPSLLEAALRGGVELDGGEALVASGAWLFTIALATGLPTSRASLGELPAASRPPARWTATSRRGADGSRRAMLSADGMPLLHVELDQGLAVTRLLPPGRAAALSTSGGALRLGPCGGDPAGADALVACVRQPDGGFRTVRGQALSGPGPTADGGVVGVSREGSRTSIVAIAPDGAPRVVAALDLGADVRPDVRGAVDELAPGSLVASVSWPEGQGRQAAVITARDGRSSVARAGDAEIACSAGRCVVARADGSLATWREEEGFREERGPRADAPRSVSDVGVSAVGWLAGRLLHVGWGDAGAPPRAPDPGPATAPARASRRLTLRCELGAPRPRSLPMLVAVEGDPAAMTAALSPPLVAGARRELHTHGIGAFPAQGVLAMDALAGRAATLSLGWTDQREVGAARRTARGAAPTDGLPYVEAMSAQGELAAFVGAIGGERWAGRARAGALELLRAEGGAPRSLALAEGGALAWWDDEGLVFWGAHGAPRRLARGAGVVRVGAPTREGVPLLGGGDEWTALRVVPTASASAELDVAGWRRTDWSLSRLGELSACRDDAPGWRFDLAANVDVYVAGALEPDVQAHVELRADARGACVERVTSVGRERFARIDLARGRAEGGEIGAGARVAALACRVDPLR